MGGVGWHAQGLGDLVQAVARLPPEAFLEHQHVRLYPGSGASRMASNRSWPPKSTLNVITFKLTSASWPPLPYRPVRLPEDGHRRSIHGGRQADGAAGRVLGDQAPGPGGMAEVFLARPRARGLREDAGREAHPPAPGGGPAVRGDVPRRGALAAQLNHPNIVQIFDFGEADGTLLHRHGVHRRAQTCGRSSSAPRRGGRRCRSPLCAKIVADACEGLEYAHELRGPGDGQAAGPRPPRHQPGQHPPVRDGAVKVVDFGIAKAANQKHRTQAGMVKGKIAYMSPEH